MAATNNATVIVVIGAPGEAEFGSNFVQQAGLWEKVCAQAQCRRITIGLETAGGTNDLGRLKQVLDAEPRDGMDPLWLVFIGHGTFDGKEARFNLRGPDISSTDLAQWIEPIRRPTAAVVTSASSAPFMAKLSRTNRVVVTATRSGHEQNYARFGHYFTRAIADPRSDLDKDGAVSLLEAFLTASRGAGEFYKVEGRIITEHALIDDNGDRLGTPADWFQGLRATKKARDSAAVDGLLARQFQLIPGADDQKLTPEQRARRDTLERAVFQHREKKGRMNEDEYYRELEKLLLEMARLYHPDSTNRFNP